VPREVRAQPGGKGSRQPDIDVACRHEVELARHDTDHFVRVVVHDDLAAHYIGRAAIAPLPQSVADDRYSHAFLIFFLGKHPPDQRFYTEYTPEIPCRIAGRDLFGLGIARERGICRLSERDIREHRVVAAPLQPFGRRGHEPRVILLPHVKPDHHKAFRIGIG
jgi:hypothetical protein